MNATGETDIHQLSLSYYIEHVSDGTMQLMTTFLIKRKTRYEQT